MSFQLFDKTKQLRLDSAEKVSERVQARMELERRRMSEGEKAPSFFQNPNQEKALKLLAGFFAMVVLFTFVSRAAAGIAIADVTTKQVKSGVLTQRYSISGTIASQNTTDIMLPDNVRIIGIFAQEGDRVKAEEPLICLDPDDIRTKLEQVQGEVAILNKKIANYSKEIPTSYEEQLKQAENKVKAAQEDYELMLKGHEVSEKRSDEDMEQAREKYRDALSDLEKAKRQAKDDLIKEAENRLEDARKALEDAEYNSDSAVVSAQNMLETAQESEKTAERKYNEALGEYNLAVEELKQAEDALENAAEEDKEALEKAVKEAQQKANMARVQMEDAQDNLGKAGTAVEQAREELNRISERQSELVDRAGEDVDSAEGELYSAKNKTDLSGEAGVSSAESGVDSAKSSLQTANRNEEDLDLSKEKDILSAQRNIESAQSELIIAKQQAEKSKQESESARLQTEAEKLQCVAELQEKQRLLELLETINQNEGMILSPEEGIVKKIPEQTGKLQDGSSAITLARTDENFRFSAMVDEKTAEQLAIGDKGTLSCTTGGKTQTAEVQISSIGTVNEEGKVRVIAELPDGNFGSEASAVLEIEKTSQQYPSILPISALRKIDGKDAVLVVRENQTVMGAEQTVEAIEVTVKAQDSENMAVEGVILMDDQVVVSASKPIEKGDRVRVAE